MKKRSQDNLTPFLLRKSFLFPFEQGKDKEQHNGTCRSDQQLTPEGVAYRQAKFAENPAAQDAADQTYDDV